MITSFTLLILGAFLILSLLLNKQRELNTGKAYFRIGKEKTDMVLSQLWNSILDLLEQAHPEQSKHVFRRMVIEVEQYIMSVFHQLSRRFGVIGDVVTGRDIPKNRGSVSFFLKNIEDSKTKKPVK